MEFATESKIKDSEVAEISGDHIEHLVCLAKVEAYLECEYRQQVKSQNYQNLDAIIKKLDETHYKISSLKLMLKTAQNKDFLDSHFAEEHEATKSEEHEKDEDDAKSSHKFKVKTSKTTLNDIIGNEDVTRMIKERIQMGIDHPKCTVNYGSKFSPRSILVFGSPGIGKTMLAEATANDLGYNFVKVTPANIKDKYVGNTEKNVVRAFEFAIENLPALLFWDEIDMILSTKEGGTEVVNDGLVGTLLDQLDDHLKREDLDLIVMAATNYPKVLPENLRRRFKFKGLMRKPDKKERSELISHTLKEEFLRCSFSQEDLDELAEASENFSYNDVTDGIGNSISTNLSNAKKNNSFKKCIDPLGEDVYIPTHAGGIEYHQVPKDRLKLTEPSVKEIVGEFKTMKKTVKLAQDSNLIQFNEEHGIKPLTHTTKKKKKKQNQNQNQKLRLGAFLT